MMRHGVRWTIIIAVVAVAGYLIWHNTRAKPIEVAVKPVERGKVERTVANTRAGTVEACRRAKLSPSVGGQISRLPIHKGDRVKEGQLLLELWNEDLKAQAVLVERDIEATRSRSRSVCLKADVARRNADRLLALRRKDVVTEERVDNAVAEATALKAECEAGRSAVAVQQARLEVTLAGIDRTRLTAPFDGTIAEINGELYEFVTPSPLGVPTPPVVDIIDNSCFYVTAPIDEVDAGELRVGMQARISMDAFKNRTFAGRVRRIADYVLDLEKQARTVDVEADFDLAGDVAHLLAGYSADIEVILDERADVVRLPTEAILDNRRVFVFDPVDGVLSEKQIKTGLSNWNWTEVREGVTPGQQVVVNVDIPGLKDGAPAVALAEAP
jgi:HlyD family secretion protein